MLFTAFIFDKGSDEGVEGEFIVSTSLDSIKQQVENAVNLSSDSEYSFSWNGLDYYPEDDSIPYGSFSWGRIYEVYEDSKYRFTEFA